MAEQFFATVVRSTGSWYEVLHEGERLQCRIRGKLRLKGVRSTNPVVVGDVVRVKVLEADTKRKRIALTMRGVKQPDRKR